MKPEGNPINIVKGHGSGLWLRNPVMIASGTFGQDGYGKGLPPNLDLHKIGAVVVKTTTLAPRIGNPPPRFVHGEGWTLNSIGLENPGIKTVLEIHAPIWTKWQLPVILSIAGEQVAEYGELARAIDGIPGIKALEINISCPNVEGGLEFAQNPLEAAKVVTVILQNTTLPIIVKLSPNVTNIEEIALSIESAGAHALTISNTLRGMDVDPYQFRSKLGTATGGISGPALKPIALNMVYRVAKVVKIPIIGVGGISNVKDALSYFMVGAQAIQIGVANYIDPSIPLKIMDGLTRYKTLEKLTTLDEIIGQI